MNVTRIALALVSLGAALALVGAGGVAPAQASTPQTSTRWRACTKTFDGISSSVAAKQRTVTIVNQTSTTYARVSFWVRTDSRCSFQRKFLTRTGRIGYGGTVPGTDRKQGTGTTPTGTWTMTEAFGIAPQPDLWLPYHRVVRGDYWVGDNRSDHYNSLRNRKSGGFRWRLPESNDNGSEYLPGYRTQYRYAVVIDFNRLPVKKKHRGTGIFLHVKGDGATAGCVAVTEHQLLVVLAYLHPGDKITIRK